MYTAASALLQAVYDDLKQPGRRCKGYYAITRSGKPTATKAKNAVAWCTQGRRIALSDGMDNLALRRSCEALHETRPIKSGSVPTNNDDLDDEQWAAWMEAAIAWAKDQEVQG